MRKLLLVGALFAASLSVSALDNEDCQFQDGLTQTVTEIAVSCLDKRAEYSYLDRDGNPATVEIDLMTPYVWTIDWASIFPGATIGYTQYFPDGVGLSAFDWSFQSASECNAADFVGTDYYTGIIIAILPSEGVRYNILAKTDEPDGFRTFQLAEYVGQLGAEAICLYLPTQTPPFDYQMGTGDTVGAPQYGIDYGTVLVDVESPLAQAKSQMANYYGSLRAVPYDPTTATDGDGSGDPVTPPPEPTCQETNTCNNGR